MKNLFKNLILWIDEHPFKTLLIILTPCIPISIFAEMYNWNLWIIDAFAVAGMFIWFFTVIFFICEKLSIFWKKLVEWAKKDKEA